MGWFGAVRGHSCSDDHAQFRVVCNPDANTLYSLPHTRAHTHTFNGPFSRTTRVSRYQKGKTKLDFTEARDSEWQWLQLGHMQVCTSFQTDNHAITSPLRFLQAGCPSCCSTNSVKALKAIVYIAYQYTKFEASGFINQVSGITVQYLSLIHI